MDAHRAVKFEPFTFQVDQELNERYCEALEDFHPRYKTLVHPGILINYSNVTRSPSFSLPKGMAAVHAKEEVRFYNLARIGKSFTVYWKVVETYEKKGRFYQVKVASIVDEDGIVILVRRITDTYVGNRGES